MEEILKEVVTTYLIPAVVTLLGAIITYVGTEIKKAIQAKLKEEQVRRIVSDVVRYIERTRTNEDNALKYRLAFEKAAGWLTSKGFNVDNTELSLLIEASVNQLPETEKSLTPVAAKKEE